MCLQRLISAMILFFHVCTVGITRCFPKQTLGGTNTLFSGAGTIRYIQSPAIKNLFTLPNSFMLQTTDPFFLITSGQLPSTSLIYQPFHEFINLKAPSKQLISSSEFLSNDLGSWLLKDLLRTSDFWVLHPFLHSSFSHSSPFLLQVPSSLDLLVWN